MSQLQFEITNNALQTLKSVELQTNFEEVKSALQKMVKPYATMVITQDDIATAKSDRANIRKIGVAINDYKKMVKKSYLESYMPFEANCKELIDILADGANNLDNQIKAFESQDKSTKLDQIKCFFWHQVGDLATLIEWSDVEDARYLNATYTEDAIHKDILAKLGRYRTEISTIRSFNSEHEAALIDFYCQTKDLPATLAKLNAYEEIKKQEDMRKTAEQKEEQKKVPADVEATDEDELIVLDFRVWVTEEQKTALRDFLKTNGIKYGKVK